MCTSFIIATKSNCFIAMNFDNNGMSYSINIRKKDWFIVYVDTGKVKSPSFGVNKSGIFFNNLMVNYCESGKYRRGAGMVHSMRFLNEIIDGKINENSIEQYLQSKEIVNVPDWSIHNMLCCPQNNVWIIEPGRGNIHFLLRPNEFKVMTNFSLVDSTKRNEDILCERYNTASKLLSNTEDMNVAKAFDILNAVKQSEGEWVTPFSMVYDSARKTVHYCENQNFTDVKEFVFQ